MERAVIERAVQAAGLELPAGLEFEVTGAEPVLSSPHFLATGAATARLLTGVGADALWKVRTGESQSLFVDARHAAAGLISFLYAQYPDDQRRPQVDPSDMATGLTRILRTADGRYVQLHRSFEDGPEVLAELGLDETASPPEIADAVATRSAFELEAALIARGLCGGVVMSKAEWADHPQGRALEELPVVRISKIGDAPPEPLCDGDRPAAGVRVLDLTRVLAGPTCAKVLAEHGADVLHLTGRAMHPIPIFDADTGIGTRQATLDLNEPAGREVLRSLISTGDVFAQGYRRGALARRGFGPLEVAAERPGIVYVSINCYGPVGPWADRPGWEQLAQAATGMSLTEGLAAPDGVPRLAPAAVSDYSTGWLAAYGAMLALARRATVGGSWHVECSLSQTAMWYQRLGDHNTGTTDEVGDVSDLLDEALSPSFGLVRYLRPALSMSLTEPGFSLPPTADGFHQAAWLER